MKPSSLILGVVVNVLTVAAACGSPPVAKSNPTWEADVYPILQGQCLHCHGQDHDSNGQSVTRFDFFDLSKCADLSFVDKAPSVSVNAALLKPVLFPDPVEEPDTKKFMAVPRSALMPPTPATSLEDWQITTIKNWAKVTDKEKRRGTRSNNHNPKIIITSKLPNDVGDELKVSYRFEDADGDPVIGVLKLGDAKVDLLKNSDEVTIKGITGSSGDNLTLSAEMCDGWKKATQDNLGEIKRQ